MEVHLGLQGIVRLEKWNLLRVSVRNAGLPLAGTLGVRIRRGSEFRRDLHDLILTRPLELPPRARKRFTFAVPIASITHPVEVFVRTPAGVVAQQVLDLRTAFNAEHVILGLTRDLGLDFLAALFQRHSRVVYLAAPDLPEQWSGYDSVSALVLKGMSLQDLSERQYTALHQWLVRGGLLVVAGTAEYRFLQEPRLQTLLPVEVLGVEERHGLPAFAAHYGVPLPSTPLLMTQARLLRGQTLVGTDEASLLAQRTFGKGRVVFLAVDYAMQPLLGWSGNGALWRDILQPVESVDFRRVSAELGLLDESHPIVKALGRPLLVYPSHVTLSLFLLAYCGGLGLLFWRLGKRQVRRGWYWGGVVLMVLGCTVYGRQVLPERTLRQPWVGFDLTIMEVFSETGYAHTYGYLGLFAVREGQFTLPFQQPATILQHTFSDGAGEAGKSLEMGVAEDVALRDIALTAWALRVFSVEGLTPSPLVITTSPHRWGLTVEVANNGRLPLQGATVVYRGKLFPLGTVAPGEAVFEDLQPALQPEERQQEPIWQALFKRRPLVADGRQAYLQEVLLQRNFKDKRLEEVYEMPFLVGWLTAPGTLAETPGGPPLQGMTLVISPLPMAGKV